MREKQIFIAAACIFVGSALLGATSTRKREEAKRAKIRTEANRQIAAIFAAGNEMQYRINSGEYQGKSMAEVKQDLEFFRIAALYEGEMDTGE